MTCCVFVNREVVCVVVLPVSVSQAFELGSQQTHEGGPQSAAGNQVLSHQGREQVNVQRSTVQPGGGRERKHHKSATPQMQFVCLCFTFSVLDPRTT